MTFTPVESLKVIGRLLPLLKEKTIFGTKLCFVQAYDNNVVLRRVLTASVKVTFGLKKKFSSVLTCRDPKFFRR